MSEVISYKFPSISPQVSGNSEQWVQSLPINGSVFRSDQTSSIVFNIASTSQFMRTVKSFVTGKLVPKDVNNATIPPATPSTAQGVSRAFSRVVIRMGGAIVEDIPNYNDLVSLYYATESLGMK